MTLNEYLATTGKQYLIESCSVATKLDNTSIGLVTETSTDDKSRFVVKGVLGTVLNERNVNGRIYTTQEMQKAIDHCRDTNKFEDRVLLCAGDDHPVTDFVPPSRASHIVTDAYIKDIDGKDYLLFDVIVLKTSNGKDIEELFDVGAAIGTSIRGFGILNQATDEVEEYELFGFDFVGDPSAGTFTRQGNLPAHVAHVESVTVDRRTKLIESHDNDSDDSLVNTPSDDKELIIANNADNKKDNEDMDLELELIKLEQRNKGKALSESTLQELVTLKNKMIMENKVDVKSIESNPVYSRLYKESVTAIKSSGVAKVESQLKESTDLAKKAQAKLHTVTESSMNRLIEAKKLTRKAVSEKNVALAKLARLQKESISVKKADRHLLESCERIAKVANKEMRKLRKRTSVLESKLKARAVVMKVMSSK